PMELESFELVLLRRPANPAQYDEATFDGIQRAHLAYHATLRVSGDIVTNGPVTDQRDEAFRGLTIYRAGSLERARELAEAGPAAPGAPHQVAGALADGAGNHPPLHLPRALEEGVGLGVAMPALHRQLARVAPPTADADGLVGDPVRYFACLELGHRALRLVE